MNSNKVFDEFLSSWRDEMSKPSSGAYSPSDHWRIAHLREAEAYANIVNSWGPSVGFLILRLPSYVHTNGIRRRYLDMCSLWRRVTNSRLRSSGFSYGGFRAVEFLPLRRMHAGDAGDLVDVCFRVACNSREEAVVILSHWVSILRLPVPELFVRSSSSSGDSRFLDNVDFGRGTSTDVWDFVRTLLSSERAVSIDIAGQTIGGSEIAKTMFCSYEDEHFVWNPMFRYKYVVPFGRFDCKYKGGLRAERPVAPPVDDTQRLSWVVPRFEHIVEYSSPPTLKSIERLFKRAADVGSSSLVSAIWSELLAAFGFDCTEDLGAIARSLGDTIARSNRRLLSTLCESVCSAVGAVDTYTAPLLGRVDVEAEFNAIVSELDNCRRALKWHKSHKSAPYVLADLERHISLLQEDLSRFRISEKPINK